MRSPEESGWSQAWRGPLRAALDHLRDGVADFYADLGGDLFPDPWVVRDEFGRVIEAPPAERLRFLVRHGRPALRQSGLSRKKGLEAQRRALLLLELSRAALAMYASCGWFFDDVAGIESALVIRQAAYALDLWKLIGGRPPTREVLDRLAEARSNLPQAGTGADVFARVSRHRTTAVHAVAATALAELAGAQSGAAAHTEVAGFSVDRPRTKRAAAAVLSGRAEVEHRRTGQTETLAYEARARGPLDLVCKVKAVRGAGPTATTVTLAELPEESRDPIALTLLARAAAAPTVTAREARQALHLARSLGSDGVHLDPAFLPAFAELLTRLLASHPAEGAGVDEVAAVTELYEALPQAERGEAGKRIQEWLWQGVGRLGGKKPVPAALRVLADAVNLSLQELSAPVRARG